MNDGFMYMLMFLLFAIVLVWRSIFIMIDKRKIRQFLPFFLAGTGYCFKAAAMFYGVLDSYSCFMLDIGIIIALVWMCLEIMWGRYGV